jgi:Recombination endonuclease VII
MRYCPECNQHKPILEFHGSKNRKDGLAKSCKTCVCKRARDWRIDNPEHRQNTRLQANYGVSLSKFKTMHDIQKGRCAICDVVPKVGKRGGIQLDHCHTTGAIRGLLCPSCNRGLASFKDDMRLLEAAISYLRKVEVA